MKWLHKFDNLKLSIGQPCTDIVVKFVEEKIKEFANTYSYYYTYNSEDLHFYLKPNNHFPQPRNSFRPVINVRMYQNKNNNTSISILLSLPHPARIVIAMMYAALFAFLGALSSFLVMGITDRTGIVVWSGLLVCTTIFVNLGRYITFKHVFLNLQKLFAQENS